MKVKLLSHVQLFETPWTVAYKASLSMEFSRQEYWSGLPFPPPGDLPDLTKIKPASPVSSALASEFFITEPSRKPSNYFICINNYYPRWHTIFVF